MPVYEYLCGKCDARFETLVRREGQEVACSKCGSKKVERKYSIFGMNLGAQPGEGRSGKGICG